jgi:hypothetical protein
LLHVRWLAFATLCLTCRLAAATAPEPCPEVPGSAVLFERPATHVVWVGEVHGTSEMPALFGDLVCAAAATGRRVVVALERSQDEQPLWDSFLASNGGQTAQTALLKGSLWTSTAQDGRSGKATLALAKRLRQYKTQGRIAGVRMIVQMSWSTEGKFEAEMAHAVTDILRRQPDALVLVYSGNLHAMKTAAPFDKTLALAASLIPASELVTVNLVGGNGQAWNCQNGDCGSHPYQGSDHPRGIVPADTATGGSNQFWAAGYDAVGYTGRATTPSPPAALTQ